ncbi:MAG: hypothetical protein ACYC6Y_26530, partial [Thermoguttaceae bacterium]
TLCHDVPCRPCHRKSCPVEGHPCMRAILPGNVLAAVGDALTAGRQFTRSPEPAGPAPRGKT